MLSVTKVITTQRFGVWMKEREQQRQNVVRSSNEEAAEEQRRTKLIL